MATALERTPSKRDFTVFITSRNNDDPKPFHCVNCGKLIFEHHSDVKLVVEGQITLRDQGKESNGMVILCKRCKAKLTVL